MASNIPCNKGGIWTGTKPQVNKGGIWTPSKEGWANKNGIWTKDYMKGAIPSGTPVCAWHIGTNGFSFNGTPSITLNLSGLTISIPWKYSKSGTNSDTVYVSIPLTLGSVQSFSVGNPCLKLNMNLFNTYTSFPPSSQYMQFAKTIDPLTTDDLISNRLTVFAPSTLPAYVNAVSAYTGDNMHFEVGFTFTRTSGSSSGTIGITIPNEAISIVSDSGELPIEFVA